ncbi:ATP-binding cassette sub-family G member 8-like [Ylistrum balloti]|uniref:ATP-binding cassette sub-family G member 8-like n=1 Tax=Ylistrum balloti TaxID=509963 RepID=UPI002905F37C|nr:ATP-binding cassette sub-family G member 8-like [Ylistrum balloti]
MAAISGSTSMIEDADVEANVYAIDFSFNQRPSVDIGVENLNYTVNPKNMSIWQRVSALQFPWEWTNDSEPRTVLKNVSFSVTSGKMLAVLGSSGSGKTSLLDVLAGRNDGGEVRGEIYLNDVARTNSMIRSCSAYVRQDDRLLAHLTVKETLMFVAQLKLPTTMSMKQVEKRVDMVISELGLRHVSDTKVGNAESRGVSGGERRRVSIGVQLLLDPSILFLDEPTSGLDAFTAHHLVETLSKLARNNRTVLMSIHQPRSDIFELFDLMMIMTSGRQVYFGEANKMVDYFTEKGFPCPALTNPCDYYVDLATIDCTSDVTETESTDTVNTLIQRYETSRLVNSAERGMSLESDGTTGVVSPDEPYPVMKMFDNLEHSPGPFRQFSVLYRRCTRNLVEDYLFLMAQFIQALSMSVVVGLVYFKLGLDQNTVRDWFGLMYIIGAMYPYLVILDLIAQYHNERHYLYYEMEDGLYGPTPYYFAKVLSELPLHSFFVVVYVIPVFFLAGFTVDVKVFFQVFAIVFLLVYCSRSLAMLSSALMPTFTLSCFFAQTFFSMYIMSAGFFINLENIFSGLKWVSSISYLKWGFQGLCLTEIQNLTFSCGIVPPELCIKNGEAALKLYSLDGNTVLDACLVLMGSIAVYLFIYYLGMKFVKQKPHQM